MIQAAWATLASLSLCVPHTQALQTVLRIRLQSSADAASVSAIEPQRAPMCACARMCAHVCACARSLLPLTPARRVAGGCRGDPCAQRREDTRGGARGRGGALASAHSKNVEIRSVLALEYTDSLHGRFPGTSSTPAICGSIDVSRALRIQKAVDATNGCTYATSYVGVSSPG